MGQIRISSYNDDTAFYMLLHVHVKKHRKCLQHWENYSSVSFLTQPMSLTGLYESKHHIYCILLPSFVTLGEMVGLI